MEVYLLKGDGSVVAVTVLLCYADKDKRMMSEFKNHLRSQEYNRLITIWDHGNIGAGDEWKPRMKHYLDEAQIILLFISSSFLASDYHYTSQMQEAIRRHEQQEVRVIPILLRSVYWQGPPLDKLKVLPDNSKPISEWASRDKGYMNVVTGIVNVVQQWNDHSFPAPITERKAMIAHLEKLIATVHAQLQPPGRADATAKTLQELSIFIPQDVTLADLVVGWRTLSQSSQNEEEIAIARRRITCGELADIASQFTTEQGNIAQAVKTWQAWRTAFEKSDDPRQATMASTFAREVSELQAVAS